MVSFRRNAGDEPVGAQTPQQTPAPGASASSAPPPTAPFRQPATDRPAPDPEHTQRLQQPAQQPVQQPAQEPARQRPVPAGGSALDDPAYERFGGANVGAAFFGWMVAVGTTVLLSGLIGAVLVVVGQTTQVSDLRTSVDLSTASVVSAAVALVVLLVAYYCGGYVAGRMSRFDGGRQGFAVWLLALLFTILGAMAGWVAGEQYGVLSVADLPTVALSGQQTTVAGIVSLVVVLAGTLLAAVVGGKVGRRYHHKVDRAL